jgi:hypothetical protein
MSGSMRRLAWKMQPCRPLKKKKKAEDFKLVSELTTKMKPFNTLQ